MYIFILLLLLRGRWGRGRYGLELRWSWRGSTVTNLLPWRERIEVPVEDISELLPMYSSWPAHLKAWVS